jgi:hypothetical protein
MMTDETNVCEIDPDDAPAWWHDEQANIRIAAKLRAELVESTRDRLSIAGALDHVAQILATDGPSELAAAITQQTDRIRAVAAKLG